MRNTISPSITSALYPDTARSVLLSLVSAGASALRDASEPGVRRRRDHASVNIQMDSAIFAPNTITYGAPTTPGVRRFSVRMMPVAIST